MKALVGTVTAVILLLLSGLHLYWAAGGRWGKEVAIPQRGADPVCRPSTVATLAVAVLLLAAAVLVAGSLAPWQRPRINDLLRWSNWILAGVFALRAIGDTRWIGFFKRVRGTPFAKLDSRIYSPLCVLLSVGCAYMATH